MKSIIFDLDGTLANMEHRRKFITGELGYKSWDKFNSPEECAKDTPIESTVNLARMYKDAGYRILIFTGRDGIAELVTRQWLKDHNVPFDRLVMRPQGNHRPGTEMKTKWLNEEFGNESWKTDVKAVFEDRNRVVKMYRELGLQCYHVQEGNF